MGAGRRPVVLRALPPGDFVTLLPVCPECHLVVDNIRPVIEEGTTLRGANFELKDADRVIGFILDPCGHQVAPQAAQYSNGRWTYGSTS